MIDTKQLTYDVTYMNVLPFNIEITAGDVERLAPHMTSWMNLHSLLILGTVPKEDLMRMINMEVKGKRRSLILERLIGKYTTAIRKELQEAVGL